MMTTFWHPDGMPMSAQEFMELLFGKLPEFFKNEAELRELWSRPDTRKALLEGLNDKGFGRDTMTEMQRIIEAENSDLFDRQSNNALCACVYPRREGGPAFAERICSLLNAAEEK